MELQILDQRDFRNRLYEQIPGEWLPDLEDAPNAAAVLDMLAAPWSSHFVVDRVAQFDVTDASVVLIDGLFVMPIGTLMNGPGITSNPSVVRTGDQLIAGISYRTVTLSAPQTIPQGTRLQFSLPDPSNSGLIEGLEFMQAQSRLETSTGLFLDLWGQDFFGHRQQRHIDETDESYRRRLLINVLAPRVSRCSVFCGLSNLTGFDPIIIEPRNTNDCGGYSTLGNARWTNLAYNHAGYYGSMLLPFQYFVQAKRPTGAGIPLVNGYSMASGGWATIPLPYGYIGASFPPDSGTGEYVTLADLDNNRAVTDNDIYQMVADCTAAGVTGWVSISSDIQSEIRSAGLLDISFYLDLTTLADQAVPLGSLFGVGSFGFSCTALVVDELAAGLSAIFIRAAGVLSNPMQMHGSATLVTFAMHAQASIDTHLMSGTSDVIPILATASVVNASNFILATAVTLPKLSVSANIATAKTLTGTASLSIAAAGFAANIIGASIGRMAAFSFIMNGSAGVTYISQNFTVTSSLLIPPGGMLAKTFLLGASKVGVNYGF